MKYELNDNGRVISAIDLPMGGTLMFGAEDVRKERTGVHARVLVAQDGVVLAYNNFNVERDEDRTRLANSAWSQLTGDPEERIGKAALKRHLDVYCFGLYPAWMDISTADCIEDAEGDDSQPAARPILPGYVYEEAGSILYGREGGGKTNTTLLMAVQIDAGRTGPFGTPEGARRVIFVNLERSGQSVRSRLARVNRALGLPANRKLLMLHARGRPLRDVLPQLQRAVRDRGIEVVFLDSLSRTGSGALVDDSTGTGVIDSLNSLGCAWFAIGHTPRGDDSHLFGSVHFEAGCDLALSLSSEPAGSTLGISITGTKANDTALTPRRTWAFEFDDGGLTKVRKAQDAEFAELEDKAVERMTERARVDLVLNSQNATVYEIAEKTGLGRTNVQRVLTGTKNRYVKVGTRKSEKGQSVAVWGLLEKGVSKAVSDTPSDTAREVYQTPLSKGDTPATPFCRRCDLGINPAVSQDGLCGSCREQLAVVR